MLELAKQVQYIVPNCPISNSWCQIVCLSLGAKLSDLGANVSGAKLSGAKLSGAKLLYNQQSYVAMSPLRDDKQTNNNKER